MPDGSHEIIDDFELDMDIETITLDDIDLREFEEPLPEEFGQGPGSMEVESIGNIENIQINTASFGGGMATGAGGEGAGGASAGQPLSGSFSLEPENITLSAPSLTIQADNLTLTSPPSAPSASAPSAAPADAPFVAKEEEAMPEMLSSGVEEKPSIESLNIDELEFGTGALPVGEAESSPESFEIPTIEKDETLHLLSEEEPPLVEEEPSPAAESPSEVSLEEPVVSEARAPLATKPSTVDENEEMISITGDELDRFLYGDTIQGVEVVEESAEEEMTPPPVEEVSSEMLVEPAAVVPEAVVRSTKNAVPLEENFELIVEDKNISAPETIYTSEPTEVLREGPSLPERDKEVPLPDLDTLDRVMAEPLEQLSGEQPPMAEKTVELEEIPLEPISLDEEMTQPLQEVGEETPTIDFVEAGSDVVVTEGTPLVEIPPQEVPQQEIGETGESFNFDLSAIPDLQPTVEDENEPIALSLEELNNIEVTETPVTELETVPEEHLHEVAVSATSGVEEVAEPFELPVEEEVPLSPESFQSIIAEEEKIDEIKQQDLNQLIEIAEPDLEDKTSEAFEVEEMPESVPPLEVGETVEVSLDDLGGQASAESREPVVSEAYFEEGIPEVDRRQMIDSNIDALSGETKEELRKVIQYLDNLLADLPEEKIREFAQSEYYDLYTKIMQKLGL